MRKKVRKLRNKINSSAGSRAHLSKGFIRSSEISDLVASGFKKQNLVLKRQLKDNKHGKMRCDLFFWIGDKDLIGYRSADGFNMVFDSSPLVGTVVNLAQWDDACRGVFKGSRRRLAGT